MFLALRWNKIQPIKYSLYYLLFLMHLGQLANCFDDDRAVLQVQNDCIATVTVLLQQQHIYKLPRQAHLPQQFHTTRSNNNVGSASE